MMPPFRKRLTPYPSRIATPRSRLPQSGSGSRTRPETAREKFRRELGIQNLFDAASNRNAGLPTPQANPFSGFNPQPQSQPQPTFGPVGGMTFGAQTQSFPQDNSNNNNTGGFNFMAGQQGNNPFANTDFSNPSGNNSFSGFGNSNGMGNNTTQMFGGGSGDQMNGDVSMDSPEKKQSQQMFQSGGQSQQPPINFNISHNSGDSGLFSSLNRQPQSSGLFGSSQPTPQMGSQPTSSLFGGPGNTPSPLVFGKGNESDIFKSQTSSSQSEAPNQPIFSFGQNAAVTSSSLFSNTAATTQPTTPFKFTGNAAPATAPAKPIFNFGGSQAEQSTGSLFGNKQSEKPTEPKSSGFIFGQTATNQSQAEQTPSTTQPIFSFGKTSANQPQTEPTASAPKPLFAFGQTSTNQPAVDAAPTAPKPPFVFGQQAVAQTTAEPSPQSAAAQAPTQTSAQATKPQFSFGTTSSFAQPKTANEQPRKTNPFANIQPIPSSQKAGSHSPEKPAEAPKPAEGSNSVFDNLSKPAEQVPSNTNNQSNKPFSGLFGSQPQSSNQAEQPTATKPFSFPSAPAPNGLSSQAPSASVQSSNVFGNLSKPAAPASGGLFGNLNKTAAAPTNAASVTPTQGNDSAPAQDEVSALPNFGACVFAPDTPCPPERQPEKRVKLNPGNHVMFPVDVSDIFVKGVTDQQFVFKFRCIEAYAEQSTDQSSAGPSGGAPPFSGAWPPFQLGSRPPDRDDPSNGSATGSSASNSGKELFPGAGAASGPNSQSAANGQTNKRGFGEYATDAMQSQQAARPPLFSKTAPAGGATSLDQPTDPAPTFQLSAPAAAGGGLASQPASSASTSQAAPTGPVAKKGVFNQGGASSIPEINAEGYKEFDNTDKLRALNRGFQKQIMAVDVSTQDIDVLIRAYVAMRNSIGGDLGVYQRTLAGTKRASEQIEELEVPSAYKKARSQGPEPSTIPSTKPTVPQAPQTHPTSSSVFGNSSQMTYPTASPLPANNNILNSIPSASKPAAPSPSKPAEQTKASQMLDSMIPKSPAKTASQPIASPEKRNVFAGIKPLPEKNASSSGSSDKPVGPSTTPSKPVFGFQPSTTPAKSPPKASGFVPSGAVTNGFAAFGQKAESGAKKRRAEQLEDGYSSSEESQAEGKREIAKAEQAKRAKYESIAKTGFTPVFGAAPTTTAKPFINNPFEPDSSGSEKADDEETSEERQDDEDDEEADAEESGEEASDEDAADAEQDEEPEVDEEAQVEETDRDLTPEQTELSKQNKGKSLFDRITAPSGKSTETPKTSEETSTIFNSAVKPGFKPSVMFGGIGKSTPEAPPFSPFTPDLTYKPASTFNFSAAPNTNNVDKSSVLGGASSTVNPKFEGLFGSRPSTPIQDSHQLDKTAAGPSDQTWKQGSPIKFGTATPDKSNGAPLFSFTAASPANKEESGETPKPLNNLFGKPAPDSTNKAASSLGFSFGSSSTNPAPGFLSAAPHLGVGGSVTSSAMSSRASSPGLTDNESVATDVTDAEAMPIEEQAKYNESRAGEEDEETIYEAATVKALRLANKNTATAKDPDGTWVTMGQGPLRVLKNKDGKIRIVIRNNTNGKPIYNEYIQKQVKWVVQKQPNAKSGTIKGGVFKQTGFEQWVIKIKLGKEDELGEVLEESRK